MDEGGEVMGEKIPLDYRSPKEPKRRLPPRRFPLPSAGRAILVMLILLILYSLLMSALR